MLLDKDYKKSIYKGDEEARWYEYEDIKPFLCLKFNKT